MYSMIAGTGEVSASTGNQIRAEREIRSDKYISVRNDLISLGNCERMLSSFLKLSTKLTMYDVSVCSGLALVEIIKGSRYY